MKGSFWVSSSIGAVALVGALYVGHRTSNLNSSRVPLHLPHVEVVGISASPGPATLVPAVQRQTQELSAAVGTKPAAPAATATEVLATLRCGDLVRKLKQTASLTAQEEARVQGVFKNASAIQAGIDAEPSADSRQLYQKQLVEQVELRLKLILKDDQRLDFARAELQGLPRLELGG